MKSIKRAFGEFEMTTRVRFVLSYDFNNRILSPWKWTYFLMKIYIVVTDVVNDVTYTSKSVNTQNSNQYTLVNTQNTLRIQAKLTLVNTQNTLRIQAKVLIHKIVTNIHWLIHKIVTNMASG